MLAAASIAADDAEMLRVVQRMLGGRLRLLRLLREQLGIRADRVVVRLRENGERIAGGQVRTGGAHIA